MSTSTSHRSSGSAHKRGAHGGGGDFHGDGEGGGGGGDGKLIKVAFARNQVEAEMLQGLLSEAGIASVLKRSFGFDNPDFLAGGPHDVMVYEGVAVRAREVLADTLIESEDEERTELEEQRRLARGETGATSPARLAFWIGVAVIGAFIIVWLLYEVT
ncbi:MAG: putative signal transducing protein [Solirubrobacterales bacterium]